jgi:hypothetical protein
MPSHRYLLHVSLLEAISFANDVPIAAALNAMHMSQDLYVVESEDACSVLRLSVAHIKLQSVHHKQFPSISLLKLTVKLEFSITAEIGDQFWLLPYRLT